jgi:3-phosphoshikimate 1-carboxyvinyltransferase
MLSILIRATKTSESSVRVPGDKSISHRALMLAAIAGGTTSIAGANTGADVIATASALAAFGVRVETAAKGAFVVTGCGRFEDPSSEVDCGNSGSTMRMLAGLAAGRANATLTGDESLRRRPMERVARPLREMGADIHTGPAGLPPLVLARSARTLRGAIVEPDVPSAQVKTAVLFAGLRAEGETVVIESLPTRDHTERMLLAMGADIDVFGSRIRVRRSDLRSLDRIDVPGDFSAAFFFIAGAVASQGSCVILEDVGVNPTRVAALDVLAAMGADVRLKDGRTISGEPIATIEARGGNRLRGVDISPRVVPNLIDEIPALCALAALAEGTTTVSGAADLRAKESDRIATTVALVQAFGGDAVSGPDGITVQGKHSLRSPGSIGTSGDHRIGMSAAILAAATGEPLRIEDAECIATSFPGFESAWNAAFCG